MTFNDFAAAHGLLLPNVEFGRWVRVPTTDKPHHKNGAYKHIGDAAFVQNHATMADVACWFPEGKHDIKVDQAEVARIRANADRQIEWNRQQAACKAVEIMRQARLEQHAYLDSKGFPEAVGLVYRPDEKTNLLIIPMRVGRQVVGCQLIDRDGAKKFLFGQRCSGAEFLIGNLGVDVWCEGFATGLSIHAAGSALKARYRIHICFSAGNLVAMAKATGRGFVVADNDVSGTGQKAAAETGLPFFLPPNAGDDFNDLHKATGTFATSQLLRQFMQKIKDK
jgi:putative DNA primase/helicase